MHIADYYDTARAYLDANTQKRYPLTRYYNCVACQVSHWYGTEMFEAHLLAQSKEGFEYGLAPADQLLLGLDACGLQYDYKRQGVFWLDIIVGGLKFMGKSEGNGVWGFHLHPGDYTRDYFKGTASELALLFRAYRDKENP